MTRPRDSQRQKVYDAESALGAMSDKMDLDQIRLFVEKVMTSAYVQRKYERARHWKRIRAPYHKALVSVTDGRRRRRGGADPWHGQIRLPVFARHREYVLHELAHILVNHDIDVAWHGWEFTSCLLDLVRHFMGKEAHDLLKASFKKSRVRFTEKRTRTLTEEQRAELRDRLVNARAAKEARAA